MTQSRMTTRLRQITGIYVFAILFVASANAATEKVIYNFSISPLGESPQGRLTEDAAGNLYGTTYSGDGLGLVFELSPKAGGWSETILYNFTGDTQAYNNVPASGAYPIGGVIFDGAGNLYGTTSSGGQNNGGTVFELSPSANGWQESVLLSFNFSDGASPSGGLIFDQAGNLYGVTESGGDNYCDCGTVFELSPNLDGTWTETTLYIFLGFTQNGSDGARPFGSLTFDSLGNLYGTTLTGGYRQGSCAGNESEPYNFGCGTVYELTPTGQGGWTETQLYAFTASGDGANPSSGVVLDKSGNVYGTTSGQISGNGTVYRLAHKTWSQTTIGRFNKAKDGRDPWSGLVFDNSGNLYGTAQFGGSSACYNGCGTIYELTPAGQGRWEMSVLYKFTGRKDGAQPMADLLLDPAGELFAASSIGRGICRPNCGAVVALTPGSGGNWTPEVLFSFSSPLAGALPLSNLIADKDGNMYGTTQYGGDVSCNYPLGCGTAFKLSRNKDGSWTNEIIHRFTCQTNDGTYPVAGLIIDKSGTLYGTTPSGGDQGCTGTGRLGGIVFSLTPGPNGQWKERIIDSFESVTDGDGPYGGLILDKAGNLYGTTERGGANDSGTVFELTRGRRGWKGTVLYSFGSYQGDGDDPLCGLTWGANGVLYGTTSYGGNYGYGTVFKLTRSAGPQVTWTEQVLYGFYGSGDGESPQSSLAIDRKGNLYGTAVDGGAYGAGVVFVVSRNESGFWDESVLHSFIGVNGDGAYPYGNVTLDGKGGLYGTTYIGGTNGGGCGYGDGCGIVYRLVKSKNGEWKENVLHRFSGTDGAEPYGGLLFDRAGNLWGTTRLGSVSDQGTIFELSVTSK